MATPPRGDCAEGRIDWERRTLSFRMSEYVSTIEPGTAELTEIQSDEERLRLEADCPARARLELYREYEPGEDGMRRKRVACAAIHERARGD